MFEPLVEFHSTEDRPVGRLAESWEISPDKKDVHLPSQSGG